MDDKIRVLIVDDSTLMREALKAVLEQDPSIEVIGMAKDGKEGVQKALDLKPNVITMDLKMPMMSGLETIETIMEELPIPIIVVSTMDVAVIVKALSIGAMDFVAVTGDIETISAELIDKIKIASRVKPLRRIKVRACAPAAPKAVGKKAVTKVVAIGISTGGPQALQVLFAKLPKNFGAGLLVVQHMSKGFIGGLAEWLNASSCLEVRVARTGDTLKSGMILLAPDDYNMCIDENDGIILKEDMAGATVHVPSIDAMMKSVAKCYESNAIGVLMTGMGQDGVEGMKAIKKAGGKTIAQDEKTSVIFGMNKMAIDTGCVDSAVPLDKIADEIVKLCMN